MDILGKENTEISALTQALELTLARFPAFGDRAALRNLRQADPELVITWTDWKSISNESRW